MSPLTAPRSLWRHREDLSLWAPAPNHSWSQQSEEVATALSSLFGGLPPPKKNAGTHPSSLSLSHPLPPTPAPTVCCRVSKSYSCSAGSAHGCNAGSHRAPDPLRGFSPPYSGGSFHPGVLPACATLKQGVIPHPCSLAVEEYIL